MKIPIMYDSQSMTLTFQFGKHYKCLQCPFGTWWKARKYFKKPKFKFYFGPMWKYNGKVKTKFGEYDDYEYKGGYWPAASAEFLKWHTPKWFPIHIVSWDIGWKDKYNTPRYERPGYFIIFFGRDYHKHWQFSMTVTAPDFFCNNDCTIEDHDDNYWESMLWYLHYADTYNTLNNKRDIVKARNSMMKQHWSSMQQNDVKEFKINRIGDETLYMGYDDMKDFVFIDVVSDELYDKLEDENPTANLQSYDDDKSISLTIYAKEDNENNNENKSKFNIKRSQYIKLIDDEENNRKYVRIYFKYDNDLLNMLKNKEYSKIEITTNKYVDIGPSFKDDFLTAEAIEKIKKYHKNKKENEKID
jgi:hypothetical protein